MLPIYQLITTLTVVLRIAISLFRSLLPLSGIRMFRWIKHIDWKFQENRPLQNRGHLLV